MSDLLARDGMVPQLWTLVAPWPKPPLSMNDRLHFRVKAKLVAQIRKDAYVITKAAGVPRLRHATVAMIWTVPDRVRRDEENPLETGKPWFDGMIDAGVVPDDVPEWMTKLMPIIEYVKGVSAVRFEVSGVPADSCTTVGVR